VKSGKGRSSCELGVGAALPKEVLQILNSSSAFRRGKGVQGGYRCPPM